MFDIDIRGGVNEKTRAKIHFRSPRARIARRAAKPAQRLLRAAARRGAAHADNRARSRAGSRNRATIGRASAPQPVSPSCSRISPPARRAKKHLDFPSVLSALECAAVLSRGARALAPPCAAPPISLVLAQAARSSALHSTRREAIVGAAPRATNAPRGRAKTRRCKKIFFLRAGGSTSASAPHGAVIARRALTRRRAEWTIENSHRPLNCRRRR
jgi:hypothetical protein